jgi:POT family proton-dependent oligopeptide transporter
VLFFTEMWERFGFYLMLGILIPLYDWTAGTRAALASGTCQANDIYGTYIASGLSHALHLGACSPTAFSGYPEDASWPVGLLMAAGYLTLAIHEVPRAFIHRLVPDHHRQRFVQAQHQHACWATSTTTPEYRDN